LCRSDRCAHEEGCKNDNQRGFHMRGMVAQTKPPGCGQGELTDPASKNDKGKRLMALAVLCFAACGHCTVTIGEAVTQGT
jgi:hypothetical protein